jgi:hypothetical protein
MIVSELIGEESNPGLDTNNESVEEDVDNNDGVPSRQPHMKDHNEISDWLSTVVSNWDGVGARMDPIGQNQALEGQFDSKLPRLSDYKEFIKNSESYHWLVCKLRQYEQLSFGDHNVMDEIGTKFRKELRAEDSLRKMSTRKPLPEVHVDFDLQWHPQLQVKDHKKQHPLSGVLEKTLCLTGTWCVAQAVTVTDYMRQTWPITGEAVVCLFEKLIRLTQDQPYTSKTFLQ